MNSTQSENKDKVLEKIKKLIKLRDGAQRIGSLEESQNAAARIQELLLKYNLEEDQISTGDTIDIAAGYKALWVDMTEYGWNKNEAGFNSLLLGVIARANMAKFIIYESKTGSGYLTAKEETLPIIMDLYTRLLTEFRALSRSTYPELLRAGLTREKPPTYRRGYLRGACSGLRDKFLEVEKEMKANDNKITALMVVKSDQVEKATYKILHLSEGSISSAKRKGVSGVSGYGKGYKDGKSTNLNNKAL